MERFCIWISICPIFFERFHDDRFEPIGNIVAIRPHRRRFHRQLCLQKLEFLVHFERRSTAQQFVERQADRIEISSLVDIARILDLFRRHISRCTHLRARDRSLFVFAQNLGNAEIHHLDPAIEHFLRILATHHDIRRFEISVNDALMVCEANRIENDERTRYGIVYAQGRLFEDSIECRSIDVFHDDGQDPRDSAIFIAIDDIHDVHDVRMNDFGLDSSFGQKTATQDVHTRQLRIEHFERIARAERFMVTAIDDAHAAFAYHALDNIATAQNGACRQQTIGLNRKRQIIAAIIAKTTPWRVHFQAHTTFQIWHDTAGHDTPLPFTQNASYSIIALPKNLQIYRALPVAIFATAAIIILSIRHIAYISLHYRLRHRFFIAKQTFLLTR